MAKVGNDPYSTAIIRHICSVSSSGRMSYRCTFFIVAYDRSIDNIAGNVKIISAKENIAGTYAQN